MEFETTVTGHPSKDKYYFRTAIPQEIALKLLKLKRNQKKQKIKWKVNKEKVWILRVRK